MNKTILFYLNHPAHYHLFKHVINRLIGDGYDVRILIVKKDVLEDLVRSENWNYANIFPEGRRIKGLPVFLNTIIQLIRTEIRLYKIVKSLKPDLMVGTEGTLAHTSKLLNIPYYLFNEDDTSASPQNYLIYPFLTKLIAPECCDKNKWESRKVTYKGYHELFYLHPKYFMPDRNKMLAFNPTGERYFILRLVELTASHDAGKKGIDNYLAYNLIQKLKRYGKVFISAERPLEPDFEKYRLKIDPKDIFHALYYADLVIGDSQTVIAESAVLGTPAVRFNDFVGKLSYLNELELKYDLTYGFATHNQRQLLDRVEQLLKQDNLKSLWQEKRDKMLEDTVDCVDFAYNIITSTLPQHASCVV